MAVRPGLPESAECTIMFRMLISRTTCSWGF
ncbi:hypothetical protein QFZ67_001059 [Streptomyces sp. V1I1]|nr:hypothetical protein [Streptomyces sp. V1I1]